MRGILDSRTFVVVGASNDEKKVGYVVFKNLINAGIKTYPVNLEAKKILGKKSYKSLLDVKKVDCVIIAIPARFVLDVFEEIVVKEVKNVVLISAGFSEAGNMELSDKILKIVEENGINLIGPNTLGFVNPHTKINASFFEGDIEQGKIAFISQSGAIGTAVLDKDIGFSGFVSIGNSLSMDFSDFIDYFGEDKNTEIITLYIESIREGKGQKFIEACKRCKKPIVVLKSGKTEVGKRAASSHTAALASEAGIYEGIFKQLGLIEVGSIEDLFDIAKVYVKFGKIGKKVCIVTNAGGPGVLASDICLNNGIKLPELDVNVKKKLDEFLPKGWSRGNPVDILGDARADRYEKTLKIIEGKDFDLLMVLLTPQYMTEPEEIARVILKIKKPVIACFLGDKSVKKAKRILDGKVILFDDLKKIGSVLGKV